MNQKGNIKVIIFIVVFALLIIVGVGLFMLQTKQKSPSFSSPSPIVVASPSPKNTFSPVPTSSPVNSTVVVIESKANISATDLDQLQKRVVNPYLDYYKETNGEDYLVSLTIAPNSQPSKTTYPYTAKGIYKNGAYNDFLVEKNVNGIVWWLPECLNGCNLSEAFKAKYPEIATKVQ